MKYATHDFTIADFAEKSYAKPIEETGQYTSEGLYINTSSILTRLIQETGRFCERFASDLFIDWRTVERDLESRTPETPTQEYLFGLREDGVDGATYILARYKDSPIGARYNYRKIYRLTVGTRTSEYGYTEPFMTLHEVER